MTDHDGGSASHPGSGAGVLPAGIAACADGSAPNGHPHGGDPAQDQDDQTWAEQEQGLSLETLGEDDEPHQEMLERLRETRRTLAAHRRTTAS